MDIKQTLENIYLEYVNNYLTIEKFAEHQGIKINDLKTLISLGWEINSGHYYKKERKNNEH